MPERELMFSVTLDDCKVETFMVGGAGGQHRDRTYAGVKITHLASGASGRAVDDRSQLRNKKAAWKKMAESPKFQYWLALERARREGRQTPEEYAAAEIANSSHLRVEVRGDDGKWVETDSTPGISA
ncbi:peptide chain release factor family protein [Agromyces humi]|uniref:peptide chain release factor family protein n=1 Tax=Agromyces humi TaxID=1766800 RepID=UPI00135A37C5|nr:peptide chain release factor-like protein [Agromyces humi]